MARPGAEGGLRRVDTTGLGPRSDDDLLLIDDTGRVGGSLLGGTANQATVTSARDLLADGDRPYALVEVDIDFDDATAAGLTCGGHVDVLVQRLDDVPGELWDAIATGRPAALVTRLGGERGTLVVSGWVAPKSPPNCGGGDRRADGPRGRADRWASGVLGVSSPEFWTDHAQFAQQSRRVGGPAGHEGHRHQRLIVPRLKVDPVVLTPCSL